MRIGPASTASAPIPAGRPESAPVFGRIGSGWVPCLVPGGAPKTEPDGPRVDPKPPKLGRAWVPGVELVPPGAEREGEPNDGSKGGGLPAGTASGEKLNAVTGLGAGPTYGGAAGGGSSRGGRADADAAAAGKGAEALGAAAACEEVAAVGAVAACEEAAAVDAAAACGEAAAVGAVGICGGTGVTVASGCDAS